MIKLNIKNSKINENEIYKYQAKVSEIHQKILNKSGEGSEMLDWYNHEFNDELINDINNKVDELKNKLNVEILLTIGIGGSFLGAQSGISFINGYLNVNSNVIFAGINISSSLIKQIENKIENKNWAICIISKSGTTLEPAISFRHFKNLLEKKVGNKNLNKYIVSITDKEKGTLRNFSNKKDIKSYVIPDGIGGRFSGITPVGFFPMAFAGLNIKKIIKGVEKAKKDFSNELIEKNIAYKYAILRNLINKNKNLPIEILVSYDQDLDFISEWWKQLFGESEGKDEKGIFPSSVSYTRDLHSLGQFIQEGKKLFFETTLWINNDNDSIKVEFNNENLDDLNYLSDKNIHEINKKAFLGVVKAHSEEGNIPNIIIELKDKSEESLGYLWYFFFVSVTMSGYFIDVNPFNQPGVEIYKKNMFKNLKEK